MDWALTREHPWSLAVNNVDDIHPPLRVTFWKLPHTLNVRILPCSLACSVLQWKRLEDRISSRRPSNQSIPWYVFKRCSGCKPSTHVSTWLWRPRSATVPSLGAIKGAEDFALLTRRLLICTILIWSKGFVEHNKTNVRRHHGEGHANGESAATAQSSMSCPV